uniref:ZP domain-containing protein n=1 Tax=Ascaris lumbricoides TaxID=6252 RepID=A0A0M3IEK0_ASCLU
LKGGADGEPLKYAIIGEVVYHKWTCSGVYDNIYCMTVHSCMVDDGQGNRHEILDEMGCGTDRYLLNDLEYLDQLSAGQEAQVFKFADRPSVFFSCQIRLELRDEVSGQCDVSEFFVHSFDGIGSMVSDYSYRTDEGILSAHPIYARNQKEAQKKIKQTQIYQVRQFYHELILRMSKRISRETAHHFAINLDVATPSVDVLDLSERTPRSDELKEAEEDLFDSNNEVCISRLLLFAFGALIAIMLITTIAIAAFVIVKNREMKIFIKSDC